MSRTFGWTISDYLITIVVMKKFAVAILCVLVISAMIACGHKGEILKEFSFDAVADSTVFDQTRARFTVDFESSSMGVFIKSIDGVANTKSAYWLFYVNDQPASQAANTLTPQAGDKISWRLVSGY